MTIAINWDVVVDHSADPDYWTVYTKTASGGLMYTHTLATADLVHMRDVDGVNITDHRTGQPWTTR